MALFVHLTPEKNIKSIKRNGIKLSGNKNFGQRGVYAMPVIQNFYISHQWLRELKRWKDHLLVFIFAFLMMN